MTTLLIKLLVATTVLVAQPRTTRMAYCDGLPDSLASYVPSCGTMLA